MVTAVGRPAPPPSRRRDRTGPRRGTGPLGRNDLAQTQPGRRSRPLAQITSGAAPGRPRQTSRSRCAGTASNKASASARPVAPLWAGPRPAAACPADRRTFSRSAAMRLDCAASRPHRATGCPARAATMASAVPQEPAPTTHRLMSCRMARWPSLRTRTAALLVRRWCDPPKQDREIAGNAKSSGAAESRPQLKSQTTSIPPAAARGSEPRRGRAPAGARPRLSNGPSRSTVRAGAPPPRT